jgi:hypothetical protein
MTMLLLKVSSYNHLYLWADSLSYPILWASIWKGDFLCHSFKWKLSKRSHSWIAVVILIKEFINVWWIITELLIIAFLKIIFINFSYKETNIYQLNAIDIWFINIWIDVYKTFT